ncbi:MAG: carbohydrate ABC transporter permease, partial [Halanaerobiales bacterium]
MKLFKGQLSLKQRKSLGGYLFIIPFFLGFVFFFLYPFLQSITFSLNDLEVSSAGYELNFIKFANYHHILMEDPDFVKTLTVTVVRMVTNVPLILGFSFFAALILNQKFKGRMLARVIFFLPVIYSAGIIFRMENTDYLSHIMMGSQAGGNAIFSGAALRNFLLQTKLPSGVLDYIIMAVDRIPIIIKSSGIQILVFLAGLQSIPSAIYEAADVEGSSAWESFWLITLPLLSPLILTNTVYTIIDSFTSAENQLISLIKKTAFTG